MNRMLRILHWCRTHKRRTVLIILFLVWWMPVVPVPLECYPPDAKEPRHFGYFHSRQVANGLYVMHAKHAFDRHGYYLQGVVRGPVLNFGKGPVLVPWYDSGPNENLQRSAIWTTVSNYKYHVLPNVSIGPMADEWFKTFELGKTEDERRANHCLVIEEVLAFEKERGLR